MKKTKIISVILAAIMSAGIFVIPNKFSESATITAEAADTPKTVEEQIELSGIDNLKTIDMGPPESESIVKDYTSITIDWKTVKNADRYLIYVMEQDERDYTLNAVTSKTKYKISDLKPNTIYQIKITPVKLTKESKNKEKGVPESKGRSKVFKVNTKKYKDSVQNISYSVSDMTRPKYEKKDGKSNITKAKATITITWDSVSSCDTYQVIFKEGYSESMLLPDFSYKNGKVTAVVPIECGRKIKCTIYPCLWVNGEDYRGKGKTFNISIDAPKLTCIDLSNHGFVSCGNNTYYDESNHSLGIIQIFISLALDSYGYSFASNSEESKNNYWVYNINYNSTRAGKIIFDNTSSKLKIILKDAEKNVF